MSMKMNDLSTLPPHNRDAEEAVIGSILIDGNQMRGLPLEVKDFYDEHLGFCFFAFKKLQDNSVSIDQITVAQTLNEIGKLSVVGGAAYLSRLIANCASPLDCRYYAEIVKKLSTLRGLIEIGGKLTAMGFNENQDISEVLKKADEMVLNLRKRGTSVAILSPEDWANSVKDRYNKLHTQEISVALSTGINSIDTNLGGGLFPGEMIVLAARPGMGKTTLVQNIANNIAQNKNVLFCSVEMTADAIADRDVAGYLGIPINVIRRGGFDDNTWVKLLGEGLSTIQNKKLYLYHDRPVTTEKILQAAISMQLRYGLDLIVIDHLGLLDDEYGRNPYERISYCSRKIKLLSLQLNVPVLLVAQLNRDVAKREDKRPQLSDLRDSGRIEEDADVIMLVHRESYYNDKLPESEQNVTEILFAKQRQGDGDRFKGIRLIYNKKSQSYHDESGEGLL